MKKLLSLCITSGMLSLACAPMGAQATDSTYAKTRYPIVLAHGMLGFAKIGPVEYWNGIPDDLQKNGAKVYVTRVSAFNSSEERGEQLLAQVQDILAISGAAKVNIIGHSHGNQSARYVAGIIPDKVASVTSVSGPTFGSPVADAISKLSNAVGPGISQIVASLASGFGQIEAMLGGGSLPQNSLAGMNSLTTEGAADFNRRFPGGVPSTPCADGASSYKGVRYYSWSGTGLLTNPIDISDPLMLMASTLIKERNDGLVGKCASHLGQVLRDDYNMNHLDTVNHVLGLVGWGTNPVTLYRQHANRLKLAGL